MSIVIKSGGGVNESKPKVVYYLEPWLELNDPYFRLGAYRDYIRHECFALIESGWDVALLTGEAVKGAIEHENIAPDGLLVVSIEYNNLTDLAPNYYVASKIAFDTPNSEFARQYKNLVAAALGEFDPDIIVVFESAFSSLFRLMFKDKVVIDSFFGWVTRSPFPKTITYDPFGSFSNSALSRFSEEKLFSDTDNLENIEVVSSVRKHYDRVFSESRRNLNSLSFDAVVLLPLQVSEYFAFDFMLSEGMSFHSQLDFLLYVLDRVPSNIGVIVTEHARSSVITHANYHWLRKKYRNLIFSFEYKNLQNPSQYLVPLVDGVITVSSSVGYQACLFNKYLCVLGDGHLAALADSRNLDGLTVDRIKSPCCKNAMNYFLLSRYCQPFKGVVLRRGWLSGFLGRVAESYQELDCSIFKSELSNDELLKVYTGNEIVKITNKRPIAKSSSTFADSKKSNEPQGLVESFLEKLNGVEIVSFDIFDTLLYRNIYRPSALLEHVTGIQAAMLSARGVGISAEKLLSYRSAIRKKQRSVGGNKREDARISEMYKKLGEMLSLEKSLLAELLRVEVDLEKKFLAVRPDVKRMFDHCVKAKRRVFLVSDMYLDGGIVEEILSENGISGYEGLLVSSECGVLKRTGKLYDLLIDRCVEPAEKILHVGDDFVADYQMSISRGIKALQVGKVAETVDGSLNKKLAINNYGDDFSSQVFLGVISSLLYGELDCFDNESLFSGSPYAFGLFAGALPLFSYSQWIIDEASKDDVTDLFFLSRDGYYPKYIVEKLVNATGVNLRCHYLRASRSLLLNASLYSVQDIYDLLEIDAKSCTVLFFLKHRFNLVLSEDYFEYDLNRVGLNVDDVFDQSDVSIVRRVKTFLHNISDLIIDKAQQRRERYKAYLASLGFFSCAKAAIVDIGHNGSLQSSLGKISERSLTGYYFATFKKSEQLKKQGHTVKGYLLEFEDPKASKHLYCSNLPVFEFLFIPVQDSVSDIKLGLAEVGEFDYVEEQEDARKNVAGEVGRGIKDFCDAVIANLGSQVLKNRVSKSVSISVINRFVQFPDRRDLEIFNGVYFADVFGGQKRRHLLSPKAFIQEGEVAPKVKKEILAESWWKQGALELMEMGQYADARGIESIREKLFKPIVRPFIYKIGKATDLAEFEASPRVFFANVNKRVYRFLGVVIFGSVK